MLIIAGLGNPGTQYAGNRHNIGFMAVDEIQRRPGFAPWSKKFKALISEGEIAGEKILLMKPQTFMNVSGESVGEAMRFYKLGPENIVAVYDELDLVPGKARIKTGGGHGGHNGIKSLDAHCGKDYRRLRLGIGHPGHKDRVQGHVLGDFAKSDRDWLEPLLAALADNAEISPRPCRPPAPWPPCCRRCSARRRATSERGRALFRDPASGPWRSGLVAGSLSSPDQR